MNPPPSLSNSASFHARNWWSNGMACRVFVACALGCIVALFMPWKHTVTGYQRQGDFDVLTKYIPPDNAFSNGAG